AFSRKEHESRKLRFRREETKVLYHEWRYFPIRTDNAGPPLPGMDASGDRAATKPIDEYDKTALEIIAELEGTLYASNLYLCRLEPRYTSRILAGSTGSWPGNACQGMGNGLWRSKRWNNGSDS